MLITLTAPNNKSLTFHTIKVTQKLGVISFYNRVTGLIHYIHVVDNRYNYSGTFYDVLEVENA